MELISTQLYKAAKVNTRQGGEQFGLTIILAKSAPIIPVEMTKETCLRQSVRKTLPKMAKNLPESTNAYLSLVLYSQLPAR